MADGIVVSSLFRTLSTLSDRKANSSLGSPTSPFPERNMRKNGCKESYMSSVTGGSVMAGTLVRCCRGSNSPGGIVLRRELLKMVTPYYQRW